MKSMYDISEVF